MQAISSWVARWQPLLTPGSTVLDLACGGGRHMRYLAAQGHCVTGVDRTPELLAPLRAVGEVVCADLEDGPWPLAGRVFDAIVVTNYLWRPRWAQLRDNLAPGGILLYETFAAGHAAYGRPARPEFLLQPQELLTLCQGWHVLAYEHGLLAEPERMVQRVAARRPGSGSSLGVDGAALALQAG